MDPIKDFLKQDRSGQIYQAEKTVANVRSAYGIFRSFIGGVVFFALGLFFFLIAKITLIGLGLMLFGILIPFLSIWNRSREMSALKGAYTPAPVQAAVPADEVIIDHIAGVSATGMYAATFVLGGGGAMRAPQNCIVLTNKNVWFIYVPMPGGDVITEHTNVAEMNAMFSKADVEAGFQKLVSQGGLGALIGTHPTNSSIALSDLKTSTGTFTGFVFTDKKSGKDVSFASMLDMHQEAAEKFKALFAPYMV
jgi:hypothetical protein